MHYTFSIMFSSVQFSRSDLCLEFVIYIYVFREQYALKCIFMVTKVYQYIANEKKLLKGNIIKSYGYLFRKSIITFWHICFQYLLKNKELPSCINVLRHLWHNTMGWVPSTTEIYFLRVLEVSCLRSRYKQMWFLSRPLS